jgi:hypothetical protein
MSNFDDLPTLRIPPGPTDDQIEFQNDLAYLRALVDAIVDCVIEKRQEFTW